MDSTICGGCALRVEPIKVFKQDLDGKRWWLITQCPRERCEFNIDIELCDKPGGRKDIRNKGRGFWKGDHWE